MEWVSLEVSEAEMLGIFSHLWPRKKKWRAALGRLSWPAVTFPACWSSLAVSSCLRTAPGNCLWWMCWAVLFESRHTFYTFTSNTSITCTQEVPKAKITKLPKETHGCCHRTAQQSVVSWQSSEDCPGGSSLCKSSWKFNGNSNSVGVETGNQAYPEPDESSSTKCPF